MTAPHRTDRAADDATVGELVAALTDDAALRFRQEVELARAEIREEMRQTMRSSRILVVGGYVGHLAFVLLSFALAWGLAVPLGPGAAFLVVGLVYATVAGLLLIVGRDAPGRLDGGARSTRDPVGHTTDDTDDGSDKEARWDGDPTT